MMRNTLVLVLSLFSLSSQAADLIVPRAQFTEDFKKAVPGAFCAEKTYFRKCFDITEDKCTKAVATGLAACFTEMDKELPAQFKQPADGQAWGEKLGACAGKKYEAELVKAKKATADCKDPAKWK